MAEEGDSGPPYGLGSEPARDGDLPDGPTPWGAKAVPGKKYVHVVTDARTWDAAPPDVRAAIISRMILEARSRGNNVIPRPSLRRDAERGILQFSFEVEGS